MTLQDLEPFLTYEVKNAIVQHMFAERPNEACGVITFTSGEYRYEPKTNIHEDPEHFFKFDKKTSAGVQRDKTVVAFVHTHPTGDSLPSKRDMEIQKLVGKPSVIASLDPKSGIVEVFSFGAHLLDLELENRQFRYGVTDCYEAIRSWRWQKQGVKMDAFPRHNGWWSLENREKLTAAELDMYGQYYQTQGYVPFEPNLHDPNDRHHPKVGDLVLMQMGSNMKVVNHAAIYIGNNLIYHHRIGKKSGNTPLGYCLSTGMVRQWARQGEAS